MSHLLNEIPPGCLVTYTGRLLDYFNPHPDMIDIVDIAVGLSREFRFGNQTEAPYSVAQHSLLVSTLVGCKYTLEALLHDATEAYMKDLPAPLKGSLMGYRDIEERLMKVIAKRFEFKPGWKYPVKQADIAALEFEWQELIVDRNANFCWGIEQSKLKFLERFNRIMS